MKLFSRRARRASIHSLSSRGDSGQPALDGLVRPPGSASAIASAPGRDGAGNPLGCGPAATATTPETSERAEWTDGDGATILVLEDDSDVRELAVNALRRLGYRVLEANDAPSAMRVLVAENGNVDLLLSDIVLPGDLGGPGLAAKARHLFPDLRLIFISGYAANLYTGDTVPGFSEPLLTKPFRLAELTATVQNALAR